MRFKQLIFAGSILVCGILVANLAAQKSDQKKVASIPATYPPGELGEIIKLGRELVEKTDTHPLSKPYVGNALSCSSCHLMAGTVPYAASFLGTAAAYPAWSPREKRVITLEDRILNCFMRSQNGIRPPKGSKVSIAISAYITWLSTGSLLKMNPLKPLGPNHVRPLKLKPEQANAPRGKGLYQSQCADCHGITGEGTEEGPPVWGEKSYNAGAGFSRNEKLAAWLKVAMPPDDANMTEQDALDIAAYVNSHSRPRFVLKDHLPKSDRMGVYEW
ncbi:Cytochrome c [Gimesia fumaroli]|uniref:Cytochrome c n=1 Tax=Gimesia fumaroli TaxID=2527976 RepID=A0A518IDJ9_9PLAN|nr:c-type cytochrome [Gimesia fumaroli]QDV51135.1 Cytochrome c [Gimesia fumaroli]